MNKKIKNLIGLMVFFFLAVFSVNSVSAYHKDYYGTVNFTGDKGLTSVIVREGLTSISERAFEDCENLKEVNISDSVTSIGKNAFAGCKKLKLVTISRRFENRIAEIFPDSKGLKIIFI